LSVREMLSCLTAGWSGPASPAAQPGRLYAYAVELTWLERREGIGNRRHQQLEDAMTLVKGAAVTAERDDWR